MPSLVFGQSVAIELPAQWLLTAIAAASSSGRIIVSDISRGSDPVAVADLETKTVGPFNRPAHCHIVCELGSLSYELSAVFTGASSSISNIVKITQAEYDALTPDATTLYLIDG